jgi:uncharacterized membrane protein
MGKGRIEAFSDGVLAIVITIMVLELKVPLGGGFDDLRPVLPKLLSYALSFIYVGIYWSNHHHLFHAVKSVRGAILWANLHLLFWLSLTPFTTAWMGEHPNAAAPVALYGADLLMNAVAYTILVTALLRHEGPDSVLAKAIGRDLKGWASLALYAAAIPLAFFAPAVSIGAYVAVALIWLIPDRRIERAMAVS